MNPPHSALTFGWRIPAVCGIGAMLAACFPPYHLPFLLPFAIAGFLYLLEGLTPRRAFYAGFACGMVFFGGTLFWLSTMFGAGAISLCAIAALFPGIFALLYVWLRQRLPRLPVWLLAAIAWTGVEVFRSEWMRPDFAFMGLGYAVVDSPVLVAPAAWFGSYGLTFVFILLGAALITLPKKLLWFRLPLLLVWLLLIWLPRSTPAPVRPLNVRLVQANSEDDESLFRLSQGPPVDVIIWPEYSYVSDPRRDARLWQKLTRLPQDSHCSFLFGAKDQFDPNSEDGYRNTAFLLGPDGNVIGTHVKNHTVHFIRDGVKGKEAHAIATPLGRLGVAICFDFDYPDVARREAQDGAEVFLVPGDNPREWGPVQHRQHQQMFQMRAIECGRWIAGTDVARNTFAVAPTGQVTRQVHTTEPVALEASVGRETRQTLFVRGGWQFGSASLLALILLCVWAALPTRFRPQ